MTFRIEKRGSIDVLVYAKSGCRPASDAEVEAWHELTRWRTVADGLAEQLREKEGYGPPANLKDYEAAKKGTT